MVIEIIDIENVGMWRGNIENIFIDIMTNEINKGNMDSNTFSTKHKGECYLRSIV